MSNVHTYEGALSQAVHAVGLYLQEHVGTGRIAGGKLERCAGRRLRKDRNSNAGFGTDDRDGWMGETRVSTRIGPSEFVPS